MKAAAATATPVVIKETSARAAAEKTLDATWGLENVAMEEPS